MYLFITLKSVGTSSLNRRKERTQSTNNRGKGFDVETTCTSILFTKCPDDSSEATPTTTETNTPERQSILLKTAARQRLLPLKPARPIFLSRRSTLIHLH